MIKSNVIYSPFSLANSSLKPEPSTKGYHIQTSTAINTSNLLPPICDYLQLCTAASTSAHTSSFLPPTPTSEKLFKYVPSLFLESIRQTFNLAIQPNELPSRPLYLCPVTIILVKVSSVSFKSQSHLETRKHQIIT